MRFIIGLLVPCACIALALLLSPAGQKEIAVAGFAILLVLWCDRRTSRPKRPLLRTIAVSNVAVAALVLIKALWLWVYIPRGDTEKLDLMARRAYLIEKAASLHFGTRLMPAVLPKVLKQEWALVTLSMTSAALANIAFQYPETRPEALSAIESMIENFLEPELREFEIIYWGEDALDTLAGPNGHIGFLGHLNFTLAAYRILGGSAKYDNLYQRISAALVRRIMASKAGGYLETFVGQIFIPDNMPVLASLAIHDRIFSPIADEAIARVVAHTKNELIDPATGLMACQTDASGRPINGVRGSYVGWNSFYLPQFAPDLAREQFARIEKTLVKRLPFGAAGILEYPPGTAGSGDIDSGPVVFGLSTSGTGFAIAGAHVSGNKELTNALLRTAEAVGSTVTWRGTRRYLFAPLVGDAIIMAMRTATVWDERFLH